MALSFAADQNFWKKRTPAETMDLEEKQAGGGAWAGLALRPYGPVSFRLVTHRVCESASARHFLDSSTAPAIVFTCCNSHSTCQAPSSCDAQVKRCSNQGGA